MHSLFLSYFYFLLRYNSLAIKFTLLRGFLVYSQSCATSFLILEHFITPQRNTVPIRSYFLSPLLLEPGSHQSTFSLCGFAYLDI